MEPVVAAPPVLLCKSPHGKRVAPAAAAAAVCLPPSLAGEQAAAPSSVVTKHQAPAAAARASAVAGVGQGSKVHQSSACRTQDHKHTQQEPQHAQRLPPKQLPSHQPALPPRPKPQQLAPFRGWQSQRGQPGALSSAKPKLAEPSPDQPLLDYDLTMALPETEAGALPVAVRHVVDDYVAYWQPLIQRELQEQREAARCVVCRYALLQLRVYEQSWVCSTDDLAHVEPDEQGWVYTVPNANCKLGCTPTGLLQQ